MPRPAPLLALLSLLALAAVAASARPEDPPPQPDFAFFVERVAPILEARCATCHADRRKRGRGHTLRPRPGQKVRKADHRANFETTLALIDPGNPAGSVWLRSAVGKAQGGLSHGGGGVIRIGSIEYRTMIDFINGQTLAARRPQPVDVRDETPDLGASGLVLPVALAETSSGREGRATPESTGFLPPGEGTRTRTWRVHTERDAMWSLTFRVDGWASGARVLLDGQPHGAFRILFGGPGNRGVGVVLSAGKPLLALAGGFQVKAGVLHLGATEGGPSGFLVPDEPEHGRVEANVFLPDEGDGGDDALLLVGAESLDDAAFVGLLDGGRVLALGYLERGRLRVVASKRLDPPARGVRHGLGVAWTDARWEGQLDGSTLVEAPLEKGIQAGAFGVRTHGRLEVHTLEAFAAWRVYEASFTHEPAVRLTPGTHTIQLVTAPSVPRVDRMVLRPLGATLPPDEMPTPHAQCVLPEPRPGDRDERASARPLTRQAARRFDADGDGKVSRDEFPGSDARFDALDGNGDGFVEPGEKPAGPSETSTDEGAAPSAEDDAPGDPAPGG